MKNEKGSSLVEVMVTIVVISFGLLGIAGLIVNALKSNHTSHMRTQAALLSNDIVERIRANRTNVSDYKLDYSVVPNGLSIPSNDLLIWRKQLALSLPDGTGAVEIQTDNAVVIYVKWNEERVANGTEEQVFMIKTYL